MPRNPATAATAKSLQSCPTLCDRSPPGNPEPELITVAKDGLRMKYLKVRNSEIPITKTIKIVKEYMKSFHIFCDARLKCKQWLKLIGIGKYLANACLKQKIGNCKGGSELLSFGTPNFNSV